MIRVWVSVRDPERRAALIRAFRTDASVRLVGSEAEADIVCRESEPVALPLSLTVAGGERLTARELEVLRLVAEGFDVEALEGLADFEVRQDGVLILESGIGIVAALDVRGAPRASGARRLHGRRGREHRVRRGGGGRGR